MTVTEQRKAIIEKYFEGCNEANHDKMTSCFTPDAVHYFPAGLPDVPWRGADTIATKWIWCVETLGSQWTIENMVVSEDGKQAVIEWTHWKTSIGEALRGDEWYCFDEETGLITEIRAYYASPVDKAEPINKLVEFDYVGRGYNMQPKSK
ncbi:nuclear transport factor 2 family protein [Kangiella sp.]|uniref:nuclear transport factor 2 family protein n=1 Tax=Kangiella sp. TaxID=1920245 RepID=UPI003A9040D4